MSAAAGLVGFRWVDLLEKEFDKSYVGIEATFKQLSEEDEFVDICDKGRKQLSGLGSCFVQLLHKSQTVFQTNAKLEAEVIHLREELANANTQLSKVGEEKKYLLCQLQTALLENHRLKTKKDDQASEDDICDQIQLKLAQEMSVIQKVNLDEQRLQELCSRFEDENHRLRRNLVELESELVGARLDAKYLDKELAGRIQQIQILLASGTTQQHKEMVWAQIESEMHLQRSKTISSMCFSKQRVKDTAKKLHEMKRTDDDTNNTPSIIDSADGSSSAPTSGYGHARSKIKQVHLLKNDSEELGMAILGGVEHGLPIMISEVFPNTAVGRCKKIHAGDVILAVNGDSFDGMGHLAAVKYLSALRGTIKFELESQIEEDIDEVCDMNKRVYEMFEVSEEESPRSAVGKMAPLGSHPGKASRSSSLVSIDGKNSHLANKELPEVHASPKKTVETNSV